MIKTIQFWDLITHISELLLKASQFSHLQKYWNDFVSVVQYTEDIYFSDQVMNMRQKPRIYFMVFTCGKQVRKEHCLPQFISLRKAIKITQTKIKKNIWIKKIK